MTVQKPIEDAVVNTTKTDSNGAKADLIVDNAMALFNDVLTDEEQKAVSEGNTTVSVYLEVLDVPANQVSSSDKAAAEEVLGKNDNELNETTEIGMYLDINLFKEVTKTDETTSKTESEESKITETSGKVTISIQIPDELINTDSSVERIYRIIRVHEDRNGNLITDVIEGVFDPETNTFTFETDKFSTYALAYNDEIVTYTVTYTDGVDGSEIFADQQYTVPRGDATPAFVGTPTRSKYTFAGWTPAVADTVTENVVYTATWKANSTHTHRYRTDWQTDGENHWRECYCGHKKDFAAHSGGTATCEEKAKCSVCDVEYGELAAHTHGSEWKTDGENHWLECTCGDKKDFAAHTGGTATCKAKAKCSVCNAEYGELAEHTYSEATCKAKAKCSVCGNETGELAAHNYVDGKCSCGTTDPNYVPPHEHTFVDGKCECGETDPSYVPPHEHTFIEGKCECGETEPSDTPESGKNDPQTPDDNEGLSTGAVVAIVAVAVVALGGGGFALWWFVFKKKRI
jgi:hypothetical protein